MHGTAVSDEPTVNKTQPFTPRHKNSHNPRPQARLSFKNRVRPKTTNSDTCQQGTPCFRRKNNTNPEHCILSIKPIRSKREIKNGSAFGTGRYPTAVCILYSMSYATPTAPADHVCEQSRVWSSRSPPQQKQDLSPLRVSFRTSTHRKLRRILEYNQTGAHQGDGTPRFSPPCLPHEQTSLLFHILFWHRHVPQSELSGWSWFEVHIPAPPATLTTPPGPHLMLPHSQLLRDSQPRWGFPNLPRNEPLRVHHRGVSRTHHPRSMKY